MKNLLVIMCCLLFSPIGIVTAKEMEVSPIPDNSGIMHNKTVHKATFAGGCFWCMEKPFEQLDGVISVVSGYAGGSTKNPNYKNYSSGGHIEVVEIQFNPEIVTYQKLLEVYWMQVNPTDAGG